MAKKSVGSNRKSGILLPIFSLSSEYGIGAFSKEAYEFVDFLEKAGQSYWQILPLGPTSYGDSPYQSFSTFAGNPYFIDLCELIDMGLITRAEADKCDFGGSEEYIDYEKMYRSRFVILKKAYDRIDSIDDGGDLKKRFEAFKKAPENDWLFDYSLFMALKNANDGRAWITWEDGVRLRKKTALKEAAEKYKEEIDFYSFLQFMFSDQWKRLKKYANDKGIEIIGDIPIYVAFDSSDTWANPELFYLDKDNVPIEVAGCPPDSFSATGQLWGNPLYRWDYHKQTGFKWWLKRIEKCYNLYDVVRIDHFRGFDEYYAIPYGDRTAENGKWKKGPGYDLFKVIKSELGEKKIIAEDLGFLTPTVIKLVEKTGYPGMKILQFAFDSREESDYLPHNYKKNSVVYTGTHDNETSRSWFDHLPRQDKTFAKEYLGIKNARDAVWSMIRACFACVSDTVIIPMQDYLELPEYARCNTPSTLGGNWVWRMKKDALSDKLCEKIHDFTRIYKRLR
ncbi:MAG: 4-alpha-glucanotransferase [Butyrivibrio sp.]|nr:4-alpha-glucanotransferase [Butyrivibrio sp.]